MCLNFVFKIGFDFNSSNHKRYTKNVTSYSVITIVYGSVSMDYKIDIQVYNTLSRSGHHRNIYGMR